MNDQLEQHLRDVFRQDAEHAPLAGALAQTVLRQVQQRRRARVFQLAAVSLVAAVGLGGLLGSDLNFPTKRQISDTPAATAAGPTGAVPDGGMADCQTADSPSDIATRSFSFDGTITAISQRTSRSPRIPAATLTLEVHEWFRGGSGRTVQVDWIAPEPNWMVANEFWIPPYQVGTRLLVSGDPDSINPQRKRAGICGFTRYYDLVTAHAWRTAITGR